MTLLGAFLTLVRSKFKLCISLGTFGKLSPIIWKIPAHMQRWTGAGAAIIRARIFFHHHVSAWRRSLST